MSYPPPPQPGQDPNNPYAQPQQSQQPGYGYPQQGAQPGYGYPQQGGLPQYGGPAEQGYPMAGGYGMPMPMPGGVKAARVILYVTGGLSVVGAIGAFIAAAMFDDIVGSSATTSADASAMADLGAGVLAGLGVVALIFAALGIMLAAKFASGGSGVRVGTIVYGSFMILGGVLSITSTGIINLVLGILVVVFVSKSDGSAWFNRPRY